MALPKHDIKADAIPLRPEEKLLSAHLVETKPPKRPLTSLLALQLLTGASRPEEIGRKGPVVASMAYTENSVNAELHLYEVVFGRDSLISALFLLDSFPNLMRNTITRLAELQGTSYHKAREEEPGKIVHEARLPQDPIAQRLTKKLGWEWPYYGAIDATPLFVNAVLLFANHHDPKILQEPYIDHTGQPRTISHAVKQAVEWIKRKMDENPQGLVESRRQNTVGSNLIQAWKDSVDSHHHPDGTLVNMENGIASIEVQGYVYDALQSAQEFHQQLGFSSEEVEDLRLRAQNLQKIVFEHFWLEDKHGFYFALGSDRESPKTIHPLKIRTSNMGHLLYSHILDGENSTSKIMRDELVKTLFSKPLLGEHGIRTLASHENRYRPNSYHNGSIWPWDNFYISLGLLRHGYHNEARTLWSKIIRIIKSTNRFPEFVSGNDTPIPHLPNRTIVVRDTKFNVEHAIEQPPQEIQAWTVAAALAIESLEKTI